MGIEGINQRYNDQAITGQSAVRRTDRTSGETQQKTEVQGPSDTVEISDEARELARARQAVDAAPEVRSDKVASIRKRIQDGTYSVSPELLARKLLDTSNDGSL